MLLDALRDSGSLRRFIPFDVDAGVLEAAAAAIQREYPGIEIDAVCGDFEEHLGKIPRVGRRLVVFLGSTIGNLTPGPRAEFLAALAGHLQPGDTLLLGTDLVKDIDRLVRAYDDSAGVTAPFNRNVLSVVNRELDADFDLDAFDHVARWNADEERIEMWLRATERQQVRSADSISRSTSRRARRCSPRCPASSGPRAWRPNWPRPVCVARTGGPTRPAISVFAGDEMSLAADVAGGRPTGRRCAPGQCGVFTAELRGDRRGSAHARHEAEVGGYVAGEAAAPV